MNRSFSRCLLLAIAGVAITSATTEAADRFWANAAGGAFNTTLNWSATLGGAGGASVPVAADNANFNLVANYTVSFSGSVTNTRLFTTAGNITLDLNTNTYTLTNGFQTGTSVSGGTSSLTITDGTVAVDTSGDQVLIGNSSIGNVTVSTGGNLGTTAVRPAILAGNSTSSSLTATNGGKIVASSMDLGLSAGVRGTLSLSGTGTSLDAGTIMRIGRNGDGDLLMSAGATANVTGIVIFGDGSGSQGNAFISGAGTTLTNNTTFAVGGAGSGSLDLGPGATINSGHAYIGNASGSDGTASITGTWNSAGFFVGSSGTGQVDIGSGGIVNSSFSTISNFAQGNVFVHNGGRWNLTSVLSVASGTAGTLDISSGGQVTSEDGSVGGSLGITDGDEIGVVNITGTSSYWQASDDIDVGLGDGTGTIHVSGGGLLSAGSTLSVNRGTVTIGLGGTVSAVHLVLGSAGTINLQGGTLNLTNFNTTPTGLLDFQSGTLAFTSPVVFNRANIHAIAGPDETLSAGCRLTLGGSSSFSISSPLTLAGAYLGGNGLLNISSTLVINGGGVETTGQVTINSPGIVSLSGTGRFSSSVDNQGTFLLNGDLAVVNGNTFTNYGTLRGNGTVASALTNNASGKINVVTGELMNLTGAMTVNNGTISVIGGELNVTGTITNSASTGLISAREAIVRTGGINNSGALAFSNGTVDLYGDVTQNVGARITVSNGGIANFYDDVTISPGAASVQATAIGSTVSRVVFFGSYNGGLTGGGQAFIEGDHRPGNSPGLVSFDGDVAYGPYSSLYVELAGTTRGSQYDAINVAGIAQLQGTLDVTRLGGLDPAYLTYFDIVNASSLLGTFDTFIGRMINAEKYLVPVYTPTQFRLAVALPGDANIDGTVNFNDLLALARNYNQSPAETWQEDDFDGNGTVNFNDLLTLARHYNQAVLAGELPAGSLVANDWALAQSLVPEPMIGTVMTAAAALTRRRRR